MAGISRNSAACALHLVCSRFTLAWYEIRVGRRRKKRHPTLRELRHAAIPGGEITIHGRGLSRSAAAASWCVFGKPKPSVALASEIVWWLAFRKGERRSGARRHGRTRKPAASRTHRPANRDNLIPSRTAVDLDGKHFTSRFPARGAACPVSLYKITANYSVKPFITSLMNPSGLGSIAWATSSSPAAATARFIASRPMAARGVDRRHGRRHGIAFDPTAICTLETAAARFSRQPEPRDLCFWPRSSLHRAYHLAFHPGGDLIRFPEPPTTSSFDRHPPKSRRARCERFLPRPRAAGARLDRTESLCGGSYGGRPELCGARRKLRRGWSSAAPHVGMR